jgi:16S rRNA (adenine1518-N6/adenine1519-N6)-dimethyltransferase
LEKGKKINTKELMKVYNIEPVKKLGQNFLHDYNIVEKIVLSADIDKDDCVVEVGPGLGVMTSYLAERAHKVVAVEIDRKLIPVLERLKDDHDNIEIVNEDVLKIDINKDIIEKYCSDKKVKVVANLPYYITTPIIMKFLEENVSNLESMTFLVQKEVAERICAKPGGKEYGMLTVAVNYFACPRILFKVSPSVFIPKPNVDSSVIRLDVRKERPFHLKDQDYFFKVLKAAFAQRRKTLANSLANAPYLHVTREDVYKALEEMGKSISIRGEVLSGEEFGTLSNILYDKKIIQ